MNFSEKTVLITGGASGIGLALATRFLANKSQVIICGRRAEKLAEAKKNHPEIHTIQCDLALESERIELFEKIQTDFPKLNVLINNAGIQNRPKPFSQFQEWNPFKQELAINLEAPIHLSLLFTPFLIKQKEGHIINVSSGLAFVPMSAMPTYCASKAALHSFTLSLRQQLQSSTVKVIEIIPPAVNTDLGGKGLHDFGVALDEFSDHAFECLKQDLVECAYGGAEIWRMASREKLNELFIKINPSST